MNDSPTEHDPHALPGPVLSYLDRDKDPSAAELFSPNATVRDDGRTYVGVEAIRNWIATTSSRYEYTKTRLGHRLSDGGVTLRIRLDGNFPGGTATLSYRFELSNHRITRLTIGE